MTKDEIFRHLANANSGQNWKVSFFGHNGERIYTTTKRELNQTGGVLKKLKELHQTGLNYVQMKVHKPDGVGKWRLISANQFNLRGNNEVTETPVKPTKPQKTMETQPKLFETETIPATPIPSGVQMPVVQIPGLAGVGLGQYLEAYAGSRMHQITREELSEIKGKYETALSTIERLKDENNELKRQKERLEDGASRKSFLDNVDINALLPALVGILKPNAPAAGLNATAGRPKLSQYKEALRESLENEGVPEVIAQQLYAVLEFFASNNVKFINDFHALLNQHSIKKAD